MTHPTPITNPQDALVVPLVIPAGAGRTYYAARIAAVLRGERACKPRKRHSPTLASALKQAAKAGKSVRGAEIYQDRVVLQFGQPEPAAPENPWLADVRKETKQ